MTNRFYINAPLHDSVLLEGPEFHHLAHVLRVTEGEEVELIDGQGILARARVETIDKHSASLTLLSKSVKAPLPPSPLIGLPFLRMEHLEWAIEKATELGAASFHLFPADYSEKKTLSPHQLERLQHITIAATKQCGRLYLPPITLLGSLTELLALDAAILFGDIAPQAPRITRPVGSKPILFISGPERGLSPQELEQLSHRGLGVKLHDNILRAETAPLAALSILWEKNT